MESIVTVGIERRTSVGPGIRGAPNGPQCHSLGLVGVALASHIPKIPVIVLITHTEIPSHTTEHAQYTPVTK